MAHNVKIYSTPTCPYCTGVKKYLSEKGIPYEDKNVAVDEAARDEMINRTKQMGVPVVDIDSKIIIGFDRPKIDAALGIS